MTRTALAARIRALAERPETLPLPFAFACLDVAIEILRGCGYETNDIVARVRRLARDERGGEA